MNTILWLNLERYETVTAIFLDEIIKLFLAFHDFSHDAFAVPQHIIDRSQANVVDDQGDTHGLQDLLEYSWLESGYRHELGDTEVRRIQLESDQAHGVVLRRLVRVEQRSLEELGLARGLT